MDERTKHKEAYYSFQEILFWFSSFQSQGFVNIELLVTYLNVWLIQWSVCRMVVLGGWRNVRGQTGWHRNLHWSLVSPDTRSHLLMCCMRHQISHQHNQHKNMVNVCLAEGKWGLVFKCTVRFKHNIKITFNPPPKKNCLAMSLSWLYFLNTTHPVLRAWLWGSHSELEACCLQSLWEFEIFSTNCD